MNRIELCIQRLRFLFLSLLFKRTSFKNYLSRHVFFKTFSRISLGRNNSFKNYSRISVDYKKNNQYITIGDSNKFEAFSVLRTQGGYIKIGSNNFIGERTQVQGFGGVEIHNHCMVAPNVFISSSNHDYNDPESSNYLLNEEGKKTVIEDKVWIGANSVILAGVSIGKCSIVAAGSVVTKNVPEYSVVAGVPAKLIKVYDISTKSWVSQ